MLHQDCLDAGAPRDRLTDAVRSASLARGIFPLWPVNRLFANYANTDGEVVCLLRRAGVEPGAEAQTGSHIPMHELVRLLRRTMLLSRDELWGLGPRPMKLGSFLQACHLAVHAGNVEAGLRAVFRFYHGLIDDWRLRLVQDGEFARITLLDNLPERPGREIMHVVVLQALRVMIEWLSGCGGFVERVEFRYAAEPHASTLAAVFHANFVGQTAHTSLLINRVMLSRPIMAHASQISGFVAAMPANISMAIQDRRTVADLAASYIQGRSDWDVGREGVAAALNMSAATLRRRLHEDIGVGFQELKDRLRCAAALELIAADALSLDEVARMLGFAELSSFHRAFKRWTGQRPGLYRNGLQPQQAPGAHCTAESG